MSSELGDAEFAELLKKAAELRGHLCLGLPLGIKMAWKGLRLMGMEEPASRENLVVLVEGNRCSVDAIQVVTGCSMGSRRLKVFEYGKSAATFYDRERDEAVRVFARPELNSEAVRLAVAEGMVSEGEIPELSSQKGRATMMNAFMKMSEDQIFSYRKVEVLDAKSYARPPRIPRVNCSRCGEEMLGGKVVLVEGKTLCLACAGQAYYRVSRS